MTSRARQRRRECATVAITTRRPAASARHARRARATLTTLPTSCRRAKSMAAFASATSLMTLWRARGKNSRRSRHRRRARTKSFWRCLISYDCVEIMKYKLNKFPVVKRVESLVFQLFLVPFSGFRAKWHRLGENEIRQDGLPAVNIQIARRPETINYQHPGEFFYRATIICMY